MNNPHELQVNRKKIIEIAGLLEGTKRDMKMLKNHYINEKDTIEVSRQACSELEVVIDALMGLLK